jgi:hypothetical protein
MAGPTLAQVSIELSASVAVAGMLSRSAAIISLSIEEVAPIVCAKPDLVRSYSLVNWSEDEAR